MANLSPRQLQIGAFADAPAAQLSLVLPRTKYEAPALIVALGESKWAIVLDGQFRFHAMECAATQNWKGVIVPGVSIELDPASAFDGQTWRVPGALIREGTALKIAATVEHPHHMPRTEKITLLADLPACREHESSGFTSWRIVVGEGDEKQMLYSVDATPSKES